MKKLCLRSLGARCAFAGGGTASCCAGFPTEWQGNDKWCPQSDLPPRKRLQVKRTCLLFAPKILEPRRRAD